VKFNRQSRDCNFSPVVISDELSPQDFEPVIYANFVLIVEKECVFHQLYSSGFHKKHGCLLLTGQGYPSLMVRRLAAQISSVIPAYGLFDCNPHGFSIYFAYKYGTVGSSVNNDQDICPSLQWIGLHWEDISTLPRLQDFTKNDESTLKRLSQVSLKLSDSLLLEQIQNLSISKKKGDIELLEHERQGYLASTYLPSKIRNAAFIQFAKKCEQ
jgi:DNA topoisomerase VI subunit A